MKIHEIDGYIQSIFLVEYPDKLLLLDSGCRCDVKVVCDFIEKNLERSIDDLKLVVVTHMHPDHAGGAHLYQKKYGIPVASVDSQVQWYRGIKGSVQHIVDLILAYWVAHRKGRKFSLLWYPRFLYPNIILNGADLLPNFEEWQVLKTPGHTDRDISLFHKGIGQIYVADTIVKIRSTFNSPVPVKFPDVYRQTLKQLAKLAISELMMAHGGFSKIAQKDFRNLGQSVDSKPDEREILVGIVKGFLRRLV